MLTLLIRTVLIYIFLIVTLRLMGKRQIGELEVTDLIATLLLSEVASLPIADPSIPVSHALVPMVVLLTLEVISSLLLLRVPRLKKLLSATPTVLMEGGVLDRRALLDARLSIEELMSEVRQQGYADLENVDCAILEKNGKLTVLPKAKYAPPTAEQLGLSPADQGLMHVVYNSHRFNDAGLTMIGKNRDWLCHELSSRGVRLRDLFCVTANRDGALYWIDRNGRGASS